MEIVLADERAYYFVPQITFEVARDRVEQKKLTLVPGTMATLIARPKPEEIQLASIENRMEAFWQISIATRTAYERHRTYTIPLNGPEIQHVTLLGQDIPVTAGQKGHTSISLDGVEHCLEENSYDYTFDGEGTKVDFSKYASFAKTEITELDNFSPEGMLVVPPKARATTVVRAILGEVIKPVQAQVIHEEQVTVKTLDINFRPIYALEYNWISKNKRVVIEFDAMTGEIRSGGKKMADQVKGLISRDLLFDVTADAAGLLVPGGSIAVKLVKAALDYDKGKGKR